MVISVLVGLYWGNINNDVNNEQWIVLKILFQKQIAVLKKGVFSF